MGRKAPISSGSSPNLPKPAENLDIVKSNTLTNYYYSFLTPVQKQIYLTLKDNCERFESIIRVNNVAVSDLIIANFSLKNDHPEFFWIDSIGWRWDKNQNVYEVIFDVPKDIKNIISKIEESVNEILGSLSGSIEDQLKEIYDWIITNTTYDYRWYEDNSIGQTIESVFIDKKSVCAGYSRAFQYLCNKIGIECTIVEGLINEQNHMWNLVKIDDNYYWIDVSLNQEKNYLDDNKKLIRVIDYSNFLVNDSLLENRIVKYEIIDTNGIHYYMNWQYPACKDNSKNYYVQTGCFFDDFDEDKLTKYCENSIKNNKTCNIPFKFYREDDYKRFIEWLKENGLLSALKKSNSLSLEKRNVWSAYSNEKLVFYTITNN
jgi:hypothetical protein